MKRIARDRQMAVEPFRVIHVDGAPKGIWRRNTRRVARMRGIGGRYWVGFATGLRKDIQDHPMLALRAVAMGWIVLLLFFARGDFFAETLARHAWKWNRWRDGYGSGVWWPFHIAAAMVSYAGFSISAWAVARSHAMPMVVAYVGSVFAVLMSFMALATLLGWLGRPTPLPHTLFYLVSVILPYVWHSGFVLVPLVMLLTGLLSCRPVADQMRANRQV